MREEKLFDPYYALEEGSAFDTMLDLFMAEKYPRGLPFNLSQTLEEWKVDTASLFAEFQLWKRTNPIAIRLSKHDMKEAQEATGAFPFIRRLAV
jgi:hypothetical protein